MQRGGPARVGCRSRHLSVRHSRYSVVRHSRYSVVRRCCRETGHRVTRRRVMCCPAGDCPLVTAAVPSDWRCLVSLQHPNRRLSNRRLSNRCLLSLRDSQGRTLLDRRQLIASPPVVEEIHCECRSTQTGSKFEPARSVRPLLPAPQVTLPEHLERRDVARWPRSVRRRNSRRCRSRSGCEPAR